MNFFEQYKEWFIIKKTTDFHPSSSNYNAFVLVENYLGRIEILNYIIVNKYHSLDGRLHELFGNLKDTPPKYLTIGCELYKEDLDFLLSYEEYHNVEHCYSKIYQKEFNIDDFVSGMMYSEYWKEYLFQQEQFYKSIY